MLKYKEIHEDRRGRISVLFDVEAGDYKEITILETKEGYARGGCIHDMNDEICIVINGQIKYFILDKKPPRILKKGDKIFIPRGIAHYFVALKDSIIIEWGATIREKGKHDPHARKIVDAINKGII